MGMHLVTADIEAAHDELMARGERQPGLDPDRGRYASFASFSDPDGNTWLQQEA